VTEGAKLRLFFAVDVPRPHLEWAERAAAPLRERWPEARWTPLENQHVTLKFIGWSSEDALNDICSVGREVAGRHQPSSLHLGGLGSFPSTRRVRVLWVGLDDPAGLLADLAMDLDRALAPLGFEPEDRDFRPHLTLARFKSPQRLEEGLPAVGAQPGDFPVEAIVLYRSHLSPKGPRYESLAHFPLGGPAGGSPS
jgi:2'-5' RNA ligase